ncbi:hypothetical protein PFISCL1PPCAC_12291, partial [Pristionchus fissidentatus]
VEGTMTRSVVISEKKSKGPDSIAMRIVDGKKISRVGIYSSVTRIGGFPWRLRFASLSGSAPSYTPTLA